MSDALLTTTIPLARTVTHGDATFTTITIPEPTIGDQLAAFRPGMSQGEVEIALVAHLSGWPEEAVKLLRLPDYKKVQAVLENFPYPQGEASGE